MTERAKRFDYLDTGIALGWPFWILSGLWFMLTIALWFLIANGAVSALIEALVSDKSVRTVHILAKVSDLEYWKNFGYFVGTLGVGPIAIYLASVRTRVSAEQLMTDRSKLETEQERVTNDRIKSVNEAFVNSVELLGNPNVAVKQGAIYALARLSRNERQTLHATITRIFVSFVRDQSKAFKEAQTVLTRSTMPVDVETALYAIRDRDSKNDYEESKRREAKATSVGFLFDMSNSFLLNADLDGSNFQGFNLSDCSFEGCSFNDADMSRVNFVGTLFTDCELVNAKVHAADFSGVQGLTQSDLDGLIGDESTKLPSELNKPSHWS